LPDFLNKLSTVFVPATVEMQNKIGLAAYIPTIPGGMAGKPDTVPDETAILYWNSQDTYTNGFKTLAVRTYTLTHAAVYTPASGAAFPLLYTGTIAANQPYYLVNKPADWMKGTITHLIGSRPDSVTPAAFQNGIAAAITAIQQENSIEGGVVCAGDDYLVYWELSSPVSQGLAQLQKLVDWQATVNPNDTSFENGLWDQWPGMDINPGDSFNMQFKRY
jgi:hypothetical protein